MQVPARCYDTTLWPLTVTAAQWTTPDRLSAAGHAARRRGRAAARVPVPAGPDLREARASTSLRFYLDGDSGLRQHAVRAAVATTGVASWCGTRRRAASAGRYIAAGVARSSPWALRRTKGCCRIRGARSSATGCCRSTSPFRRSSSSSILTGFEEVSGRRLRRPGRDRLSDLAVRARRPAPAAGGGVSAPRRSGSGCTPIINLFPQTSEPILLDQRRHEYQIVPDARRRLTTEIFSVDEVVGSHRRLSRATAVRAVLLVPPRASSGASEHELFWYARRRPSGWRTDDGTDVLSVVRRSAPAATVHPSLGCGHRRASPASTAICRAGCRSATRPATSSSRRRARSGGSSRSSSRPTSSSRRSASHNSGG